MRRFAALLAVVLVAACSNEIDTSTRPDKRRRLLSAAQLRRAEAADGRVTRPERHGGAAERRDGDRADKSWTESRVYRYTLGGAVQQIAFGSNGSWTLTR
jgi:hypothetical protein